MEGGTSPAYLHDLHALFEAGTAGGLSDGQLLERFASRRDASSEAAFEVLVQRHGPMVWRVCQIALPDKTEVQDAFQATFLVLVRRCRSIRRLDSVGSWLFGVASRVAARSRVEAARRRSAEQRGGLRLARFVDPVEIDSERDSLGPAVQQEVQRLPEKFRAVVLLCYWDGLTQEKAAERLGCPLGTVRSRLARARKLLQRRLTRRGLAPLAGVVTAAWDSPVTQAAPISVIPNHLIGSTVRVAAKIMAGRSVVDASSLPVAALVQQVIRSMFMTKLKIALASVVFIGFAGLGATLAAQQVGRGKRAALPSEPRTEIAKSKAQPPLKTFEAHVVEPPDLLIVEVLEALQGRPISGERLVRPDGKISLGFYGGLHVAGLTLPEIKEKVVLHLRKYLDDEILGLIKLNPDTGDPMIDPKTSQPVMIDPKDTDAVFVDVTAYNSQNYYVQGAVLVPGRLPVTGKERVLDAIDFAGGLSENADHAGVVLYRQGKKGGPLTTLPIDVDQITMGDDLSTNHQLEPGDRLVVRYRPDAKPATASPESARPKLFRESSRDDLYFNRQPMSVRPSAEGDSKQENATAESGTVRALERRIEAMEHKLDLILQVLKKSGRQSTEN
jgi:polysaccharide biosynthesis/export protein